MEIVIGIVVGLALGAAVGFVRGRSGARAAGLEEGRRQAAERLKSAADAVSRGQMPEGAIPGSLEAELQEALQAGWAPRDAERQVALKEALERMGRFLETGVRAPLSVGTADSDSAELRERMDRALGALQDLDFFISDIPTGRDGQNLSPIVQQLSREFAQDQGVSVRLSVDDKPVRAKVNKAALLDAMYLVLHNAGRFGGGGTVDVSVQNHGARALVRVRDRGEGFTKEAFARAFDPFYSTSPEGLGLGLPHARKVLEGMGGRIELKNVPDGGAEVEISFPAA